MIQDMSLRLSSLVLALAIAVGTASCGGSQAEADEPQTAREKQYAEAKKSGELDEPKAKPAGTWRYSGNRKDCFFVLGRKCFKTEKAACKAAACGTAKCEVTGGGPATVACASTGAAKLPAKK